MDNVRDFLDQYRDAIAQHLTTGEKTIDIMTVGNALTVRFRATTTRFTILTDHIQVGSLPVEQFDDYWKLLQDVLLYRRTPSTVLRSSLTAQFSALSNGWRTDRQNIHGRLLLATAGMPLRLQLAVTEYALKESQVEPQIEWMNQAIEMLSHRKHEWYLFVNSLVRKSGGAVINPLVFIVQAIEREQTNANNRQIVWNESEEVMYFAVKNLDSILCGSFELLFVDRFSIDD